MSEKFKPGDKAWIVPHRSNSDFSSRSSRDPYEATLTNVGRDYAYWDDEWGRRRFSIRTMYVDEHNGWNASRVFRSQADHEAHDEALAIWTDIINRVVAHKLPIGMTPEKARQIKSLIFTNDISEPKP